MYFRTHYLYYITKSVIEQYVICLRDQPGELCPDAFCFTLIIVISVKVTQMKNFDGTVSEIQTFHGTFAINNIL